MDGRVICGVGPLKEPRLTPRISLQDTSSGVGLPHPKGPVPKYELVEAKGFSSLDKASRQREAECLPTASPVLPQRFGIAIADGYAVVLDVAVEAVGCVGHAFAAAGEDFL